MSFGLNPPKANGSSALADATVTKAFEVLTGRNAYMVTLNCPEKIRFKKCH
jgi:hypothetical protein